MRWMTVDLQKLAAFHLVAERGSLRKVALELGLTVPAISTRIRLLEEQLDVHLFERHANRLSLTAAGRQFRSEIAGAFTRIEDALVLLEGYRNTKQKIRISIGSNLARLISPQINAFLEANRNIEISIDIHGSAATHSLVVNGSTDVGIGYFGTELGSDIERLFLRPSKIAFVCAATHPLAARTTVGLPEVIASKLIMIPGDSGLRHSILQAIPSDQLTRIDITDVGSCQSAIDVASGGGGIAVVHSACIRDIDASLRMLHVEDHVDSLDLSVIFRKAEDSGNLNGRLAKAICAGPPPEGPSGHAS